MRISVEPDDEAYIDGALCLDYTVYFNGERQTLVLTADSDKGYMRAHYRDSTGAIARCGDEWLTRDFFGDVRIEYHRL